MHNLLPIFFQGIVNGIAAFLLPCIFPLLPLTISFFTKSSASRLGAIIKALVYGLSIILIYTGFGLLITKLLGTNALNALATNWIFNLSVFFLLIIFAISFFGAFEINLPSGLVNKMDELSGAKTWIGIFFMAFTLALVSFSCTGPVVGTLLVNAVASREYYSLTAGMLGFSLALALPFTLAAIFPSFLSNLPKSGAWLNSVKVFLGFIELAASMKFLSSVDITYHLGILNRDVFLSIWIALFFLLGLYLLGKIKFSHDSDLVFISVPRFFIALFVFSFAIYLIPGLWGAPLKPLSGILPPQSSQEFNLNSVGTLATNSNPKSALPKDRKLANLLHEPPGFDGFFDYEEGLAYARKVNKPVLLDFTGNSCVNCRTMEQNVWTHPEIKKIINEDYILVSLYVDEKTELPINQQYTSPFLGSKVRTVGNLNADIEAKFFNTNSQPYYVPVDGNGKKLTEPMAFESDIQKYKAFLIKGLDQFKANNIK